MENQYTKRMRKRENPPANALITIPHNNDALDTPSPDPEGPPAIVWNEKIEGIRGVGEESEVQRCTEHKLNSGALPAGAKVSSLNITEWNRSLTGARKKGETIAI